MHSRYGFDGGLGSDLVHKVKHEEEDKTAYNNKENFDFESFMILGLLFCVDAATPVNKAKALFNLLHSTHQQEKIESLVDGNSSP